MKTTKVEEEDEEEEADDDDEDREDKKKKKEPIIKPNDKIDPNLKVALRQLAKGEIKVNDPVFRNYPFYMLSFAFVTNSHFANERHEICHGS